MLIEAGGAQLTVAPPFILQRPAGHFQIYAQNGLPLTVSDRIPMRPAETAARRRDLATKRAMDLAGALAALLLLAPLMAFIAIAIRVTSRGPAVFSQAREGLNGAEIRVYKFRTMYADRGDATGVAQTKAGDDRITPIGRLLRRSNLDELPQLFNVLRGDMSLIGPRPHPFNMVAAGMRYDEHVPYYAERLQMRPGISGWAQCNGLRGPTVNGVLAKARIDHDLAYIQNFSVLLDLRIIWMTLMREGFWGTGS